MDELDRFVAYQTVYYPRLKEYPPARRKQYCKTAYEIVKGINEHRVFEGAGVLISTQRNSVMTAEMWADINRAMGWYDVDRKYRPGEFARACWLVDISVRERSKSFFYQEQIEPHPLVDYTGKRKRTPPSAIVSTDVNGNQRKTKGQLRTSMIPVDSDALRRLSDRYHEMDERDMRFRTDCVIHVSQIEGYPSQMLLQYREDESGRLQGPGFHLQHIKKDIRNAALNGQWNYDIDVCHPTLMYGICLKHGVRLQQIEHYITHKKDFRQGLVDRHDISLDNVKIALTALGYGAPLTANASFCELPFILHKRPGERRPPRNLVETLHEQTADFISDPDVKELDKEFRAARKIIVEREACKSNKYVTNALRKGRIIPSTQTKSIASHILMGYEVLALDLAIQHTDGHLSLLLHDGFISPIRLDTAPIVDRFHRVTGGICISFDEQEIKE